MFITLNNLLALALFFGLATSMVITTSEASSTVLDKWEAISVTRAAKKESTKVAILVSNSQYKFVSQLPAPPNDVAEMSSKLAELGFKILLLTDPSASEIVQTIASANQTAERGSIIAFYYSGHAAEIDGQNNIILTGYQPNDGGNSNQLLPLQTVLSLLAAADFEKVFVAFDACRSLITSAPPAKSVKSASTINTLPSGVRGLARSEDDFRTLNRKEYAVLFSTSHGEVALDQTSDGISPFTKALSLAFGRESSFVPAMLLAKRLTEEITGNAQSPDIQIKWNGDLPFLRSQVSQNTAYYELNKKFLTNIFKTQSMIDNKKSALVKNSRDYVELKLDSSNFENCQEPSFSSFFWYSDTNNIEYCYLNSLIANSEEATNLFLADPMAPVYLYTNYSYAKWSVDLDLDGKAETIEAGLRNSDMELIISSRTKTFSFGGLIGPNITFFGLLDFNRDSVLDIFLIYESRYMDNSGLLILDGRILAKQLNQIVSCGAEENSKTSKCRRQNEIGATMRGSLIDYNEGYDYGTNDILQSTIYADWNIKDWSIDENLVLKLTTYSSTWPYESFVPSDYMVNKYISFDKTKRKISVKLNSNITKILEISPISEQIRTSKPN